MNRVLEFATADGETVFVEVSFEDEEEGAFVPVAAPGQLTAKASQTFEEALEGVRPATTAIIAKLRDLAERPNEIEVAFSVKLSAKAGVILAAASTEANLSIKLVWRDTEGK